MIIDGDQVEVETLLWGKEGFLGQGAPGGLRKA